MLAVFETAVELLPAARSATHREKKIGVESGVRVKVAYIGTIR